MGKLKRAFGETDENYKARLDHTNKRITERNATVFNQATDNPNWIMNGSVEGGWEAVHINSVEGKAILAAEAEDKRIAEEMISDRENAVENIIEELEDEENVSKIQIRMCLNKVGAFTVENLNIIAKELNI